MGHLHVYIYMQIYLSIYRDSKTKMAQANFCSVPSPRGLEAYAARPARNYLHWHHVCHRDLKLENWVPGAVRGAGGSGGSGGFDFWGKQLDGFATTCCSCMIGMIGTTKE